MTITGTGIPVVDERDGADAAGRVGGTTTITARTGADTRRQPDGGSGGGGQRVQVHWR